MSTFIDLSFADQCSFSKTYLTQLDLAYVINPLLTHNDKFIINSVYNKRITQLIDTCSTINELHIFLKTTFIKGGATLKWTGDSLSSPYAISCWGVLS